jgi:hypothetical protein
MAVIRERISSMLNPEPAAIFLMAVALKKWGLVGCKVGRRVEGNWGVWDGFAGSVGAGNLVVWKYGGSDDYV